MARFIVIYNNGKAPEEIKCEYLSLYPHSDLNSKPFVLMQVGYESRHIELSEIDNISLVREAEE